MDTRWLEDFVALAETRSFSRAAQLRHVTQPAFSRRIQSLEAWAGTELVDRSAYPMRLNPAGQTLYQQAIELLQSLQATRAMLRGHGEPGQDVIDFAVPHTLALAYFPAWISALRETFGPIKSRLTALNVHDAVTRLIEGGCDLLVAYHHPALPYALDSGRYEMVRLGQEVLAPYARPDAAGQPQFQLPGEPTRALPYLGYAPGAYLGRMVDRMLAESSTPVHLDRVYETDMAEGLKAMALQGHGVAFLPQTAVEHELRAGRLVSAAPPALRDLRVTVEVRAYRERVPSREADGRTPAAPRRAHALWDHLVAHSQT